MQVINSRSVNIVICLLVCTTANLRLQYHIVSFKLSGFKSGINTHGKHSDNRTYRSHCQNTETVNGIPAGATVTLTELSLDDPTGGTWGEPEFSESSFTVVKDTVVSIDLDNPISWNNGDFSVLKAVTGDGADLVSEDALFTVDYSYTLPEGLGADPATGTGTLTVANNGEAIVSDPLPYGTEVTISEAAPTEVAGGTWLGYEFDTSSASAETVARVAARARR